MNDELLLKFFDAISSEAFLAVGEEEDGVRYKTSLLAKKCNEGLLFQLVFENLPEIEKIQGSVEKEEVIFILLLKEFGDSFSNNPARNSFKDIYENLYSEYIVLFDKTFWENFRFLPGRFSPRDNWEILYWLLVQLAVKKYGVGEKQILSEAFEHIVGGGVEYDRERVMLIMLVSLLLMRFYSYDSWKEILQKLTFVKENGEYIKVIDWDNVGVVSENCIFYKTGDDCNNPKTSFVIKEEMIENNDDTTGETHGE